MPAELSLLLRQFVSQRANGRCEYCLLPQTNAIGHKHQPDHILPRQHGGETVEANLALACVFCNRNKGPNIGSFDPLTGNLTPFFNPRLHQWAEHFSLEGTTIRPVTPEGRVTEKIFRFNDKERLAERASLIEAGLYRV